jgi:TATA-box binding protein (TBP) (component of TFIID and TFIIIB)
MTEVQKKKTGDDLVFPDFDSIKVSTKTFTAMTNLVIDLDKLFDFLPVTDYVVVPKRRGRKKKVVVVDPNKNITDGSIITLKHIEKLRGVDLKKKQTDKKKKKKKWFRNSFTTVMFLDKLINFKICKNGTFQMTGCKSVSHAHKCVKYIWEYIKNEEDNIYTYSRGDSLEALFIPAMRNIDFSVGFFVDREKLARYMSTQKDFHCLLETSFGYTGVNIKLPIYKEITELVITKMTYTKDREYIETVNAPYQEYLDYLPIKERDSKIKADRYNTFLVFHSGKLIMSGIHADFMRDTYYYFLRIIRKCYDEIEERLDVDTGSDPEFDGFKEEVDA